MPRLASDGFVLSWSSRALLMLLDYLPTLLSAFGLALTGLFFRRLAKGERWSQRNARTLVHIGLLSFLALLLQPFINTLQGLVLSLDLPDGERVLSVSIGLTSEAAYEFLKAIFLCSFGLMMSEARKLDEEVRAFI
ncbi:hypothetical protein ACM7M5_23520 [Pseudomonas aeruginosa]|nr:hypothetical protein [Pseudomonas aeruginosa]MDF5882466.1 hypothetical protein [Pseudomonas aeruginosa]MDF5982770.1 hypothetical protein [Pseudomonas aeruginosa]MDX8061895.1 hypothetical protein [Pseudomonas aeruginosa]MDY1298010.1 hypothetical protein [Pseudomonas aeruginosa]